MSKSAKWISVIALVCLTLFVVVFLSEQLSASLVGIEVVPASDQQDAFSALLASSKRGDFARSQFREMESENASDYAFITYTVKLSGSCPLPARWAELNLAPAQGDVLLISDPIDVSPFGKGTLTATLLTHAASAGEARSLWAEYYVLGRAMNAPVHAA
ncbi:MAG: hypothetical protein RR843_04560 [Clostridia bacterium]